ncbi:MAG: hypothetical protein FJ135_13530 [Deltaproteobacteria bacterium]|nr:hypothetical protein [Deltaproteobacteria bacterium]
MSKNLLLDSGFWFALYDSRDQYHEEAQILADLLDFHNLVIPWPSLYETLNTRFVRRRIWLDRFTDYLTRGNTVILADEPFRQNALDSLLGKNFACRSYSLVDAVLRLVIQDPGVRIDAIITFYPADFHEICAVKGVELISS